MIEESLHDARERVNRAIGLFVPAASDDRESENDVDRANEENAISALLKEATEQLNHIESTLERESHLDKADFQLLHKDIRRTHDDLETATRRIELLKKRTSRTSESVGNS